MFSAPPTPSNWLLSGHLSQVEKRQHWLQGYIQLVTFVREVVTLPGGQGASGPWPESQGQGAWAPPRRVPAPSGLEPVAWRTLTSPAQAAPAEPLPSGCRPPWSGSTRRFSEPAMPRREHPPPGLWGGAAWNGRGGCVPTSQERCRRPQGCVSREHSSASSPASSPPLLFPNFPQGPRGWGVAVHTEGSPPALSSDSGQGGGVGPLLGLASGADRPHATALRVERAEDPQVLLGAPCLQTECPWGLVPI